MTKYRKRVVRSMMVRKYMSEMEYMTSYDASLLKETFLKPLKRKSKTGRELYSARDASKIKTFYKAIQRKETAKQYVRTIYKKGQRKQKVSYWIPKKKGSKVLVPFRGMVERKVEGIIERRKQAISLRKFGRGSFKDIAKEQNLSKNQLRRFKKILGGRGFNKKGKMSKMEGYLYRLWLQQTTGEDYISEQHSYGSDIMDDYYNHSDSQSFFDFSIKFIKENE